MVKNLTANAGDIEVRLGQEDPCRKALHPIPVFLPGEFNGQRDWQATVHRVTKNWT